MDIAFLPIQLLLSALMLNTVLFGLFSSAMGQEAAVSTSQTESSEEYAPPSLPTWKGEAELGFVLTGGNTRTQSLNARLGVVNEQIRWRHSLRSEVLRSSDRDETTAQRVVALARIAYKINLSDLFFTRGKYEDDRFSGYDWRITESVGYARRLLNTSMVILEISVGPGSRHSRLNDGNREDELMGLGEGMFEYKLGSNSTLSENVTVESGEEGTVTESVTALKSQLMNNLAMKLSLTINHNTKVPMGTKKTNTQTAITLVYGL